MEGPASCPTSAALADERPRAASGARFAAPLSWAAAGQGVGLALLAVATVVLAHPLAAHLLAPDAEALHPDVARLVERVRLALGVAGLVALALGLVVRGAAGRTLPVARGTVLVWLLAAGIAVGGVETVLRVRQWRLWGTALATPLPTSVLWTADRTHLRPGCYAATVASEFGGYQARVRYTVNRYGLRGPLPALPRPAGTLRVVALGGSSTLGWHVGDDEAWPARLAAHLGPDVDVVNAGRPGATTHDDFRQLRDRLLRLDPDVLVLYEGFNDLWRGVRTHAGAQPDYGAVDVDLPAVPERLDLGPPRPWRLSLLTAKLGGLLQDAVVRPPPRAPGAALPDRLDPAIVRVYVHNLRAIVRLARAHGVQVVLATFAGADDASRPVAERRARLRYALAAMPGLDVAGVERAFARYRALTRLVAAHERVPLVDTAATLPKDLAGFTDTIHFTPLGEERLAALLAAGLRAHGVLDAARTTVRTSPVVRTRRTPAGVAIPTDM